MKHIGEILRTARIEKKYSLMHVAGMTKIKTSFIDSIEREKWEDLPSLPTVIGFVKNIAAAIEIDEKTAVAVLKRDYPPKKLSINPKPDVSSKFMWSPRLTFIFGIIITAIVIFGYLTFQYVKFVSPPSLAVDSPKNMQVVTGSSVLVFGSTDSDAKITVNNQPVLVDDSGKFSVAINVSGDTKEIVIEAISRSGKITEVKRNIRVE